MKRFDSFDCFYININRVFQAFEVAVFVFIYMSFTQPIYLRDYYRKSIS